jgi:hypothetical protein
MKRRLNVDVGDTWEETMKDSIRAVIAYIAGRAITGKKAPSIYDDTQKKDINISGDVDAESANVYDYDDRCYITGKLGNLFHYGEKGGEKGYVQMEFKGGKAKGYDYNSKCYYEATVSENSVSVYDYETGKHHQYSL